MEPDRRKSERIRVQIRARIRILIPEESFSPFSHEGVIQDISLTGLKLKTWDVDEASYEILQSAEKHVRITFNPPNSRIAHILFGEIVWIDFNNTGRNPHTVYSIKFENLTERDREVIRLCQKYLKSDKTG